MPSPASSKLGRILARSLRSLSVWAHHVSVVSELAVCCATQIWRLSRPIWRRKSARPGEGCRHGGGCERGGRSGRPLYAQPRAPPPGGETAGKLPGSPAWNATQAASASAWSGRTPDRCSHPIRHAPPVPATKHTFAPPAPIRAGLSTCVCVPSDHKGWPYSPTRQPISGGRPLSL